MSQTVLHGIEQNGVQFAAVDGKLRRVETGVETARLPPHHLAEAIGVDQLAGADPGAVERGQQAQSGEFLDRVRQRIDADPEFPGLAHLLEHGGADARRVERERRRQPADAAAHDQNVHVPLALENVAR